MSAEQPDDNARLRREKEFHDERFAAEEERSAGRFYSITGASAADYAATVQRIEPPARVLELGCGLSSQTWHLLARGVEVTAIDISPVAIEAARRRQEELGLQGGTFLEMNAEELDFDDESFDAVVGSGILHHLDTDRGAAEAARVLRPDGRLVLLEPMGHNPAINAYRRRTPDQRTDDEHPLLVADFEILARHFRHVDLRYFHLLSLATLAFSRSSHFEQVLGALEGADRRLFERVPPARRWAWMVVIDASCPEAALQHSPRR